MHLVMFLHSSKMKATKLQERTGSFRWNHAATCNSWCRQAICKDNISVKRRCSSSTVWIWSSRDYCTYFCNFKWVFSILIPTQRPLSCHQKLWEGMSCVRKGIHSSEVSTSFHLQLWHTCFLVGELKLSCSDNKSGRITNWAAWLSKIESQHKFLCHGERILWVNSKLVLLIQPSSAATAQVFFINFCHLLPCRLQFLLVYSPKP